MSEFETTEFEDIAVENDVTDDVEDEIYDRTAAEKAADYIREYNEKYEKAASYVERNFIGGDQFIPGEDINIKTRNQDLLGDETLEDVKFVEKTIELGDEVRLKGVFPEFKSNHTVELGDQIHDMTDYQQFKACKEHFQEHMYDDPSKLEGITIGDMEALDYKNAPEGFTWHHEADFGKLSLVARELHEKYRHTGTRALCGNWCCTKEKKWKFIIKKLPQIIRGNY